MAGKDINIPITGDAREFIRETDKVEDALDDVADALDDMTRDTKRGGQDAERAVGDLEDSFRDAARRAKDLGDEGDDAGRKVKKGMEHAEDGVEEFKDEANSTAREAAASFDGSAESIADAFQEVAANAFAGFGPAGAVAGLAAAAGIGLAVSGFEAMDEAAKESQERANDWADAFIEAGGRVLTFEQTMAKVRDITTNRYAEAKQNAENWGVSIETATSAMAGLPSAIDAVSRSLEEQEEAAADASVKIADGGEALADMLVGSTAKANAGRAAFEQLKDEMARGGQQASVFEQLLVDTARATDGATEAVDAFGDTIITLPDGKRVYIDAETGRATQDVDAIERKIYSLPDGHTAIHLDSSAANAQYNKWIRDHDGKSIKIYGRVITSGFGNGVY